MRLISTDAALVEHVRALAEAVPVRLEVRGDAPAAADRAGLLLVGVDAVERLPAGWRGGVLVVRNAGSDPPEDLWRQAVHRGAERVVLLPEQEPWLLDALADAADPGRCGPVVGVVGGCGGAGASALAVALAVTAADRGLQPVLVDVDPLGPGLDVSFGTEQVAGLRWPDLPATSPRWPPGLIGTQLPEAGGVRLLTGDEQRPLGPHPGAVIAAVEAAVRECDVVIVDLPRHLADAQVGVLARCDLVLIVVPSQVRDVAAAARVAEAVVPHAADVRLVVRVSPGGGADAESVADVLALPLAGEIGTDPDLHAALTHGEAAALRPRRALAALCRSVLLDVLEPR